MERAPNANVPARGTGAGLVLGATDRVQLALLVAHQLLALGGGHAGRPVGLGISLAPGFFTDDLVLLRGEDGGAELLGAEFAGEGGAGRGEEGLGSDGGIGWDVGEGDESRGGRGRGTTEEEVEGGLGLEDRGQFGEGGVEVVGGGEGNGGQGLETLGGDCDGEAEDGVI